VNERKIWIFAAAAALVMGLAIANHWGVFGGPGEVPAEPAKRSAGITPVLPIILAVIFARHRRRKREQEGRDDG